MSYPETPIPWKVYGLIDPRTRRVFYVGCTYIVHTRVGNHCTMRGTSTYDRCQEIKLAGYEVDYCIFGRFDDQDAACTLEDALIIAIPDLLNRTNHDDRRNFWRRYPEIVATMERRKAEEKGK